MKLLIYTPTYGDGPRPECRASVEAQQTQHSWEWVIDPDDPFPAPDHRNVLAKYQRAKARALAGGFDALVTVEHDMVLPVDALEKMANTAEGEVVYAPYVLRHSSHVLNTWQYINNHNLGMPLEMYPQELKQYIKAGVGRISGCGWGCTLIKRLVMERIPFHDGNGANPPGDIQFAMDCLRAGVVAVGRFDAPCGHYTDEGRLLMPYQDTPELKRVEALQDVTVSIDGQSVKMIAGMRYTVTGDQAWDLERAGYVRIRLTEPEQPAEVERAVVEAPEKAVLPVAKVQKRKK